MSVSTAFWGLVSRELQLLEMPQPPVETALVALGGMFVDNYLSSRPLED
ncbi:MAG: hypothetical protein GX062_05200 [Firmicutes bacterium]|nr:hypothetical protein [Bacillota bacterium]